MPEISSSVPITASDLRPYYPEFMGLLGRARSDKELDGDSEIGDAISRLRLGTFGYCERCDQLITLERLRLFPATRFCRECSLT